MKEFKSQIIVDRKLYNKRIRLMFVFIICVLFALYLLEIVSFDMLIMVITFFVVNVLISLFNIETSTPDQLVLTNDELIYKNDKSTYWRVKKNLISKVKKEKNYTIFCLINGDSFSVNSNLFSEETWNDLATEISI
ncbi:hypothetical protein RI844_14675 [Thalassotalea fonticola]|uniref:YcxB family protein n=1 Tax=Thalassotalea fonticola TaxID=3065649 RepID=A0ABZ0GMG0_9GAMM|nr:hypothetical protein RI844_14675 [Colwelliaceae bacterium S1-1]